MIVRQFTRRAILTTLKLKGIQDMARPSSGKPTPLFKNISVAAFKSQCLLVERLSVLLCLCPDMAAFREIFSKANSIAIITGAGVSAESGVPTFRGAGGYWRRWSAQVGPNWS